MRRQQRVHEPTCLGHLEHAHERRVAGGVLAVGVDVGRRQEQQQELDRGSRNGEVQRIRAVVGTRVGNVDVGAEVHQQPHGRHVTALRGTVERRAALNVTLVGTTEHQRLDARVEGLLNGVRWVVGNR